MPASAGLHSHPIPGAPVTRFIAAHIAIDPQQALGSNVARIKLRPAPRREPPFDDEIGAPRIFCKGDQQLPFGTLISDASAVSVSAGISAQRSERQDELAALGDPGSFGRSLLTGCFEVMHGRRAPVQLVQLVSRSVFTGLARDLNNPDFVKRWPSKSSVRSVRHFTPADGVAEVSAVIQSDGRVRAAALRLEAQHGQWRCVKLQLG
jgi:hypothetical protein